MRKLVILLSIFALSCGEDHQESTICTTEFRVIYLEVVDSSGDPVILDDFQVIDLTTNEDISGEFTDFFEPESGYPVATDGSNFNGSMTLELLFIGVLGDEISVRELFEVGRGECHIFKISGVDQVALTR